MNGKTNFASLILIGPYQDSIEDEKLSRDMNQSELNILNLFYHSQKQITRIDFKKTNKILKSEPG